MSVRHNYRLGGSLDEEKAANTKSIPVAWRQGINSRANGKVLEEELPAFNSLSDSKVPDRSEVAGGAPQHEHVLNGILISQSFP